MAPGRRKSQITVIEVCIWVRSQAPPSDSTPLKLRASPQISSVKNRLNLQHTVMDRNVEHVLNLLRKPFLGNCPEINSDTISHARGDRQSLGIVDNA